MLYRMKQNAVGLANICILSTMVLVILSSTCSLWFGAEDMIHTRYPADVLVSMEDPNHMIDMDTFLTDELKSVPGGSYTSYEFLTGYDSTEETEDHPRNLHERRHRAGRLHHAVTCCLFRRDL